MAVWQVSTKELRSQLRKMMKLGRGATGDASWIFSKTTLRLEWAGMGLELPVEGEDELIVSVDGHTMRSLTRDRLVPRDTMRLKVADDRLHLGNLSIACSLRSSRVAQLLPMKATKMDLVLLPYRHSPAEIDDAALADQVNDIEDRKYESIQRASKTLSWLQIDPEHLESWVEAHLRALAAGKKTFELTPRTLLHDEDGQIDQLRGERRP